jgi:hypothetical protein
VEIRPVVKQQARNGGEVSALKTGGGAAMQRSCAVWSSPIFCEPRFLVQPLLDFIDVAKSRLDKTS